MMLLSLMLLTSAPAELAAPMTMSEVRFNECVDLAIDDPASGITAANSWRIEGGGFLARHCLGFAYAEQFRWEQATTAFVEAAREAEIAKYARTANFWAQAGNAALANGQAEKALEYLNAALVQGTLVGLYKGEVHLDRARAHVALDNYPAAKQEFALVHELAPQDPLGWLLSATLARRMDDLALATSDIENAKAHWEQAVAIDSESRPAKAAAVYLGRLAETDDASGQSDDVAPPQS